ncbi:major facilitator superfamily domain-containing protein [Boletus edulis]|nr:major facilitator superfamily domain-containing protein [Boletus edulis]
MSLDKKLETMVGEQESDGLLKEENRKAAERHILRKLDTRLMPTVVIIYLMNYIDRVAVTSARLQGLEADLGLTDVEYETVLAILYASYAPAQIPSNMILGYISRPSIYIGACVIAWGLTSALTGAAFYPGSMYLLSRWYTKRGLLISNAFGSLIAAGILGNMQGVLGGAITITIGLLAMWLLPDLPHNTRWMSPAERRLGEADQDSSETTIFDGFKLAIRDVKVWIFVFISCFQSVGTSFGNFFPTLTKTLGYNTTDTLLMSAPPWAFASICCIINAWHCDRTGERYFHMAAWWWVTIVGYIIALATMSTGARYFSLFLMTCSICGSALILNWVSNAIPRPPAKRSVAMGMVNGLGVAGSYIWKAEWGPEYHQSMAIALCAFVLASFLGLVMRQMLIHENKQMERDEKELTEGQRKRIEGAAKLEGISFEEAVRLRKGFRYLY